MELRHLRYFVAVAEELSFRAAARRLHVAQPPLSVQVKQLEEELGTRLFERTSRRVRLTPAGELFLARATTILREAATAVREVQRAGRGELGALRLSLSGTTLTYDPLLPAVLRRYRAAHPEVNLTLHEQPAGQQLEDLRAGRFVGRGHVQGQEVARRVHGDGRFAAVGFLVAVRARAGSALGRARHGAPIEDGGAGLRVAPQGQTHEHAQVVAQGFKDARLDPASVLLIDHLPGRQIVGQGAPGAARPHGVA